jgi:hypothetical protein
MSPPSCEVVRKDGQNKVKEGKDKKAAHFAESNSDRQRPHFGQVACQIGPLRHLIPRQKSQEYHGEGQIGCVMEQDVGVDEEIEGKQWDGKSAVKIGLGEKKRNAGSLEGMRVLRGVLGCMQDELGLGAAMGAGNGSCSSRP